MNITLVTKKDFYYTVVDTKSYKGFDLRKCKENGNDGSHRFWKAVKGEEELSCGGRNLKDVKNTVNLYLSK